MMDTGTTAITDIHLALIVILAVAAIAAIVWGMRMKRARIAAAERFEANQEESRAATEREQAELGHDPLHADAPSSSAPSPAPAPSPSQVRSPATTVARQPTPIPVAPSMPPFADEPAPGTPPDAGQPVHAATPVDDGATPDPAGLNPAASPDSASPADRPVTALKGLGPKVATALADRGITTVGQIAALEASQADALDADLGAFRGRMARDRWIEQARFLAAGDVKGFEAVFGRL